jgi:hypothetical protein
MAFRQFVGKLFDSRTAIYRIRESRPTFLNEILYQKGPEFQRVYSLTVWHGLVYYHGIMDN